MLNISFKNSKFFTDCCAANTTFLYLEIYQRWKAAGYKKTCCKLNASCFAARSKWNRYNSWHKYHDSRGSASCRNSCVWQHSESSLRNKSLQWKPTWHIQLVSDVFFWYHLSYQPVVFFCNSSQIFFFEGG